MYLGRLCLPSLANNDRNMHRGYYVSDISLLLGLMFDGISATELSQNQCLAQMNSVASHTIMSGVWNFNPNGVLNLVENPLAESSSPGPSSGHKILVHIASNETMSSFEQLDTKLLELGWQPYSRTQDTRQYHRSHNTSDLITLPLAFGNLRTTHMFDIVVKTRSAFRVREAAD